MTDKLICIGKVKSAHGVHGNVKIQAFTEDPYALESYSPLYGKNGQEQYSITVKSNVGDTVIATVEGVTDRDKALALRGAELFIKRDALPEIDNEEEFYYHDLIGLRAELKDGSLYGMVADVQNYGAGDILEITRADDQKLELLPFTKENVPEIHVKEGKVVVVPPEYEFASKEHS